MHRLYWILLIRQDAEGSQFSKHLLALPNVAIGLLILFSPHTFLVRKLGGMTEDDLGVTSPMIEEPDLFTRLPRPTTLIIQSGEDHLRGVLPGVSNPGEARHSSL